MIAIYDTNCNRLYTESELCVHSESALIDVLAQLNDKGHDTGFVTEYEYYGIVFNKWNNLARYYQSGWAIRSEKDCFTMQKTLVEGTNLEIYCIFPPNE